MRLISIRTAGRMLVRCASASTVHVALGATLTTPHPAIALPTVAATPAGQFAPAALASGGANGSGGACDTQAAESGLVGAAGPGWG
jgi:hypothetical protein